MLHALPIHDVHSAGEADPLRSETASPSPPRTRRAADVALIALFLVAIFVPGLLMVSRPSSSAQGFEKRRLAELPSVPRARVDWLTFPARLESWFNDHFGLRDTLIRGHNLAKLYDLSISPQTAQAVAQQGLPADALASVSSQVIPGKDGWLFFAGDRVIDDYRGTRPFKPGELDAWVASFAARERWLRERGIRYLLVIAPNTHTVYSEYLPDSVRKIAEHARVDELLAALRDRTSVDVLDLRASQFEAKTRDRSYQKTDTHWNDVGAFYAYRDIVGRLKDAGLEIGAARNWYEFTLERKRTHGGDLAMMLGLADWIEEEGLYLRPRFERRADWPEGHGGIPGSTVLSTIKDETHPRAVVFHDSFTLNLMPLLSEHFSRVRYQWTYDFQPALVEKEQPDVVIEEFLERILQIRQPSMPPELQQPTPANPPRVLAN